MDGNEELKREISLGGAVSLIAGMMIGSGVFILTGKGAGMTGPSVSLAFALAGLAVIFFAAVLAVFGAAMPRAGGTYVYPSRILSPFWGTIVVWSVLLGGSASISITALGFSSFLRAIVPSLPLVLTSVVVIWVFFFINLAGVKISSIAQTIMVVVLLLALIMFAGAGLFNLRPQLMKPFFPEGISGFLGAWILLLYAYAGYQIVVDLGGEIKNPQKNIPRALGFAFLIVIVVYLSVSIAAVGNLNWVDLGAAEVGLVEAAEEFLPSHGVSFFIVGGGLLALSTTLNGCFLAFSRDAYAAARDKILPSQLASVNKRFRTPHNSLFVYAVISTIAIVAIPNITYWGMLIGEGVAFGGIILGVAGLLFPFRYKETYEASPFKFRGPLKWIIPLIAVLISVFGFVVSMAVYPEALILLLTWIGLGILYYCWRKKSLKKRGVTMGESEE
jgi:Amino acid transporters